MKKRQIATWELDELMHYKCDADLKSDIDQYCNKWDITASQFGRWADVFFLTCFPDCPPVKGEIGHAELENLKNKIKEWKADIAKKLCEND